MERFGEKISTEACSGKEIAGLLKKMMMMHDDEDDEEYDDTENRQIAYERILAWQTGGR